MNSTNQDKVVIAHSDFCRFVIGVQKMDMEMLNRLSDKISEMMPWLDGPETRFAEAALEYIGEEFIAIEEEKGLTHD